ncbi:MAG: phage Gp37/Gp68 family protein, partial [Candidatus Omnitrophica bacterium]|nr:phage Gp37/Gp68 family protein [Candidatus Omnitrophota bacterium]
MANSSIEWTEFTWNFVTGCDKVSQGCKFCYAEIMSRRLKAMGSPKYSEGFGLRVHPEAIELPLAWSKPRRIFVNSMSDLFHRDVPEEVIQDGFEVMRRAHWHQFQILTKRSERLLELSPRIDWPENVWMGVSVEDSDNIQRIDHLRLTGARIKFLSLEPLLGPLPDLNL